MIQELAEVAQELSRRGRAVYAELPGGATIDMAPSAPARPAAGKASMGTSNTVVTPEEKKGSFLDLLRTTPKDVSERRAAQEHYFLDPADGMLIGLANGEQVEAARKARMIELQPELVHTDFSGKPYPIADPEELSQYRAGDVDKIRLRLRDGKYEIKMENPWDGKTDRWGSSLNMGGR